MVKLHPRVPIPLIPSPTTPSSGTDRSHWECGIRGGGTPIALLTWCHQATGRALGRGGVLWGLRRKDKGGYADAEESRRGSSSYYLGASPRSCLPSQEAKTENIYTYLQLQYKRAANLMIRDYYLKGPTVTDLFVISCNNTDGNEFICINVNVTRTSVEILH